MEPGVWDIRKKKQKCEYLQRLLPYPVLVILGLLLLGRGGILGTEGIAGLGLLLLTLRECGLLARSWGFREGEECLLTWSMVFCAGFLGQVKGSWMGPLGMFFVTRLTREVGECFGEKNLSLWSLFSLFFIAFLGGLMQKQLLFYGAGLFLIWAAAALLRREGKDLFLAGSGLLLLMPRAFSLTCAYRETGGAGSFFSQGDFLSRLLLGFHFPDQDIFGGFLKPVVLLLLFLKLFQRQGKIPGPFPEEEKRGSRRIALSALLLYTLGRAAFSGALEQNCFLPLYPLWFLLGCGELIPYAIRGLSREQEGRKILPETALIPLLLLAAALSGSFLKFYWGM